MAEVWRLCSTCKKPLSFQVKYYECSVSTCTGKRTGLVFCTIECWERHLTTTRHRDAGAIEKLSPTPEQWAREQGERQAPAAQVSSHPPLTNSAPLRNNASSTASSSSEGARRILVRPNTPPAAAAREEEILVVVSRIRQYVKDRNDMNTSQEVYELLSDQLRRALDQMMDSARRDGRKTVMARDFSTGRD